MSLSIALALLVSACQTTPIPLMRSGGKSVTGQVQVATRKLSLIGEFSARYNENEFECEVSKGAGLPLITVHTLGNDLARVEGGGRIWQGNPRFAPSYLRSWIELGDVFAGKPDSTICLVQRTGKEMRVNFLQNNDRFVFLLDTQGKSPRP